MIKFQLTLLQKKLWIHRLQITANPNAPTLVFLHEGLGSVAQWKDFPQRLCEKLGCNGIVYDRQGHGESAAMTEKRGTDYLHIEALQYLPRLLQELQILKPILIGHSDGATIALIYAAFYPKQVQAVVTEAAHIKVEGVTLKGIEEAVKIYQNPDSNFRAKLQKYHSHKTDDLFYAWANTWLSPSFRDWNIADLLPQIECPVLLLQGKEDEYATESHLWEIAAKIGENATAKLLEDCGHSPHWSQTEKVLGEIEGFVRTVVKVADR